MNMNELAREICEHEGLKQQVSIAQVKEILRVLVEILASDFRPLKAFVGYLFKQVEK